MKKQNNRFRNGNNNNNGYTLNYKFDSVSIAGKISGTALDLIRKYNDLAKEAQSSGNYVDMEIYRQYAEHYRKIVTDINEKRQARYEAINKSEDENSAEIVEDKSEEDPKEENIEKTTPIKVEEASNGYIETLPANEPVKAFQVVEISEEKKVTEPAKPKRVYRRRTSATQKTAEA